MTVRVGTSGWSHDGGRLEAYAAEFGTVELAQAACRWPGDAALAAWAARVPAGFRFALPAPRELTHDRLLYSPELWIERIARAWTALGERTAALLVELPDSLARDDDRLDWFLAQLPHGVPAAVEFRHRSWHVDEVFDLLQRRGAAYCVTSGAQLPCELRRTAQLVYLRLHGPDHENLHAGSYSDDDLHWWAERVREWTGAGADVQACFTNAEHGHALRNARTLRDMLGVAPNPLKIANR